MSGEFLVQQQQQAFLSLREERIQRILSVKFNLLLSQEQLTALVEGQVEPLRQALQQENPTLEALDGLVERLSEAITGMAYPTEHSTPYYKEYFKKKLAEGKRAYFGL